MDTFHSSENKLINKHKLLNLKVVPMFLD